MKIHLIERLRNQKLIDRESNSYESGNWNVKESKARELIGGKIYFHERQADASYFGGLITDVRILPETALDAGRAVFTFISEPAAKGVFAGAEGWRYEQKTVN